MASATKCDRCGKYYDVNNNTLIGRKQNVTMAGIVTESKDGRYIDSYDLCDECANDFIEFINGREISEAGMVR